MHPRGTNGLNSPLHRRKNIVVQWHGPPCYTASLGRAGLCSPKFKFRFCFLISAEILYNTDLLSTFNCTADFFHTNVPLFPLANFKAFKRKEKKLSEVPTSWAYRHEGCTCCQRKTCNDSWHTIFTSSCQARACIYLHKHGEVMHCTGCIQQTETLRQATKQRLL